MKYLKKIFLSLAIMMMVLPSSASALIPLSVNQGGSGVNTITGIIYGNGTVPFAPVTIGSGLTFSGGTLSSSAAIPNLFQVLTAGNSTGGLAIVSPNGQSTHTVSNTNNTLTTNHGSQYIDLDSPTGALGIRADDISILSTQNFNLNAVDTVLTQSGSFETLASDFAGTTTDFAINIGGGTFSFTNGTDMASITVDPSGLTESATGNITLNASSQYNETSPFATFSNSFGFDVSAQDISLQSSNTVELLAGSAGFLINSGSSLFTATDFSSNVVADFIGRYLNDVNIYKVFDWNDLTGDLVWGDVGSNQNSTIADINDTDQSISFDSNSTTTPVIFDFKNSQVRIGHTSTPLTGALGAPNNPFLLVENVNGYSAGNNYNRSSGKSASADWIVANDADDGTIFGGHFEDMGINSSAYDSTSSAIFSGGPNAAYLLVNGGSLNLMTQKTFPIYFRTGGYSSDDFIRGFISATAPTINFGRQTSGGATGIYQITGKTSGIWSLTAQDATSTWTLTVPKDAPIVNGQALVATTAGISSWQTLSTGSVTSVSIVSANGFSGTVATASTTPAITLSTTVTGILKGNGTAISAATAGTDYQAPITLTTTGTSGAATFVANTLNIPNYSGGSGTVTSVAASGGATGLTFSGSPITTSGTLTLAGTLAIANGGTNNTTQVTNGVNYFDGTRIKSLSTFLFDGTNLGVGATPDSIFTVSNQTTIQAPVSGTTAHFIGLDGNPLRFTLDTHNNANGAGTALIFRRSRGTAGTPSAVQSADTIGSLNGVGYGTSAYGVASTGLISIKALENFTNTAMGTGVTITTTPIGSITGAESARFTSTGETLGVTGSLTGTLNFSGVTSGLITVQPQSAAGTYNFNLPTTAGSAGQVLTSQGGGTTAMTWTAAGTGTVTSVGFTGGLISVATPTTTPAFTVAGTSGGIPYFSSTSTWASSALLTANAIMIGGGSGTAPTTTTTGTGVLTALGLNVNGSGAISLTTSPAFITPSLGVATATSINGNSFTTGTGTLNLSTFTLTAVASGNVIIGNPGAANRVMIATSSTAASGNSSVTFDNTDFSVGTSPNTSSSIKIQNSVLGTAADAQVVARSSSTQIALRSFSGGYTTSGLNIADVSRIETGSSVGMQFISTAGSTSFTWGIGGTANTNSLMTLDSTGLLTVGLAGTTTGKVAFSGATSGTTTVTAAAAASGTLTLPAATGTLVIGSGANTRIGLWTSANNISSSASLLATATAVTFNTSNATSTSILASNANTGVGATAFISSSNNTVGIKMNTYGTSYTTAGLLVAGLTSIESTSTAGLLHNIGSGGTYWWDINSTSAFKMSLDTNAFTLNTDLKLNTVGNGLYIKEGTNATMGICTLVAGTCTVSTTKVTANSRIFLTVQSLGTVALPTVVGVTARSAGTSFTITSASVTDTSVIAWEIVEPL